MLWALSIINFRKFSSPQKEILDTSSVTRCFSPTCPPRQHQSTLCRSDLPPPISYKGSPTTWGLLGPASVTDIMFSCCRTRLDLIPLYLWHTPSHRHTALRVCSRVRGHLGWVHFLAMMNNAVNICVQVFAWPHGSVSLGSVSRSGVAGSRGNSV